ncbi:hypothetical protein [Pseudaquabacterium pictum]|uniref:Uncharacterized protein n=1 Tax=Pseudaquabacterium pictum TaxID=2315236 RepID=A0A480ATK6_9BURK|nr:hypothetical protein [Rubrivivax pictus]GCL62058.1 hypothetical protein AQPW35_11390 [Rubrivivax pictus]
MTQHRFPIRCLRAALAVAAASLLGALPAQAQTRAALVQSIDEPGRSPFQETLSDLGCRTTTVCSFNFSTVPAGKRLVVTHIAGYVDTGAGTLPNGFFQSSFGGSGYATLPFTGVRGPSSALGVRIFINHDVLAFFGPGESPRGVYHVNGSGDTMSGGALMMVTGYYVNLP